MDLVFYTQLYTLTLGAFLAIDLLWLGVVARGFYRTQPRPLLSPTANWRAAFVFYLLYVVGILIFATLKDWPLKVVLVDMAWGVVLCTAVASAGFLMGAWLASLGEASRDPCGSQRSGNGRRLRD